MNHCVLGFETFLGQGHMTVDQYFPEMQKRIQLTSCYKHDVDFPCGGYGSHPEPVWPVWPTKPLWFWHFYSCSPWTVVTGPEPHLSDMSIWWAKKRLHWYSLVRISRVVKLKWTDQIVAIPQKQSKTRQETITHPWLSNHFFFEPRHFIAYAYCLPKSRGRMFDQIKILQNKQYKPRRFPKSVLPFSLPLLNLKANIHDAGGPHKKETRNVSHQIFMLPKL